MAAPAWHAMVAGWSPVLAALAALSIVIGNLVALAQSNVRRLLAYSAVAHAGYTLIGLVAGGRDGFSAALVLHDYLRDHARRRVRRRRRRAARNRRRRFLKFFRTGRRVRRCSPDAWRSSCCPSQASRRWPDFLESSICSVPRCAPAEITRLLWLVALGALWQFRLALLLPDRAESDFC